MLKKQKYLKIIKNQHGFVAVEAILSMSVFVVMVVFVILLCAYQIPKIGLENQVQSLCEVAKMQGGLTNEESTGSNNNDIDNFVNKLQNEGFDKNGINIRLTTSKSKINAIGVSPINSSEQIYVKRSDLDPMTLRVEIAPKISKILFYKMPNYVFQEEFLSERN